jgi:beta-N-acetylhexosaminidase
VGNLILYGNNIASGDGDGGFGRASTLISRMKETMTTDIPPLVAIDLEGGKVVRFGWDTWPDSAYTLGKKNDPDHAYRQFQDIGNKLLETGFNTNLAPVLDITTSPMDSFLGTRIISGDPQVAGSIGGAIIRGLHGAGCLSVAKHFPGHGGTTKDSHDVTPVVNRTAEELRAYDLLPFQAAIEAGVDAVLVAHILYPALDETDIASMSEPIITGLLRNELGFTGVVVSDDFRMGGLTSRYSVEDAAVRFLLAGGDLIMCGIQPDRQRRIMEGLRDAAASGRLPAERIDESVARVLNMKLSAGLWTLP